MAVNAESSFVRISAIEALFRSKPASIPFGIHRATNNPVAALKGAGFIL
jgi:hypothetical protein